MHNEELTAEAKVRNCLSLDYPATELELLFGSDASEDRTDDIVRSFDDPRVRLVRLPERQGKSGVLNAMLQQATGEFVLLTDADIELAPDVVRRAVSHFADPKVAVVQLNYRRVNKDGSTGEGMFDRWETWVKALEGDLGVLVSANGFGMMIRRADWSPIPLDTIHDDLLVGIRPFRSGGKAVFESRAVASCKVEEEGVEFRRRRKIGRGNMQALVRLRDLLSPKYGLRALAFFSHKTLRALLAFALPGMLAGCAIHLTNPVYAIFFWVQVIAYLLIPAVLLVRGRWRRVLLPSYYLLMNIALLVGSLEYLFGPKQAYWDRTPRS